MKLLLLLTLLVTLTFALDLDTRQRHGHRQHKKTSRPKRSTGVSAMRAADKPRGAPAAYKTSTDRATRKRSKTNLKPLPADLIDPDQKTRRDSSLNALRLSRRQAGAADFYECGTGPPAPADADCQVVIDQVLNSNETLVVNTGSCLTFVYQTCQGFFCALCDDLATTTDFVGNQLDSAEALCVADGFTGTVVGQDAPQWDAGLLNVGDGLPSYDVC